MTELAGTYWLQKQQKEGELMDPFGDAHELALSTIRGEVLGCREDMPDGGRCWQPADYVLWGKLIKPEGLGPRCYKPAALHIDKHGLRPGTDYALIHLDDLARALAARFTESVDLAASADQRGPDA